MDGELLVAIHECSSWLSLNIRVLVRYAGVLNVDEREVYASRTTHSAFNHIENAGDNYLSQYGPGWVQSVLEAHLAQSTAALAEVVRRIAERLSPRIHANVGLGPFVAVMFGLPLLFSWDRSGAQITAEIMAGMYEATAGGLHRAGQDILLRAMHQFAAFIVCARYCHWQRGGAAVDFYGTISPGFTLSDVQGAIPDLDSLWTADNRAGCAWALVFPIDDWNWRLSLQRILSEMAASGSTPAGTVMQPSGCLYWETLVENPSYQRMWLRCAETDCTARFTSRYYPDTTTAVAEARSAGWYKPSTKTWNQGARCPLHGRP